MKVKENPGGNRGESIERESRHDLGKLLSPPEAFHCILRGLFFRRKRPSDQFCYDCESCIRNGGTRDDY